MARTGYTTDRTDQRNQILSSVGGWEFDISPGVGLTVRDRSGRKALFLRQGYEKPRLQVGELPPGRVTENEVWLEGSLSIRSVEYKWPDANSAGVLTNDGAGVLSWGPGGGGGTYLYDCMLAVKGLANGLDLVFGVEPRRFRSIVDGAEFRAKAVALTSTVKYLDLRTAAEGGTSYTGTGTNEILDDTLDCGPMGTQYLHTSPGQLRWFFAWRVHLATGGTGTWSLWSSGEADPNYVTDYVDTLAADLVDDGPPQSWTVTLREGVAPYTCHIRAGRPATHGTNIFAFLGQVRYTGGTGTARRTIDDADVLLYDGSTKTNCTYNKATGVIDTVDGDLSSVNPGDLILFNVTQGAFTHTYCQWGTVVAKNGNQLTGLFGFRPYSTWTKVGGVYTNVRIKIVTPPGSWTGDGYMGDQPGNGLWGDWYATVEQGGDLTTQWFETGPIQYPNTMTISQLEATVWFENPFSRGNDDTWSTPGSGLGSEWIIYLQDSPNIEIDCKLGCMFEVTLGGARTLSIINGRDGQPIGLRIRQDGTGGRTLALPATVLFCETIPDSYYVLSDVPGEVDLIGFQYDATKDKYEVITFMKGYE